MTRATKQETAQRQNDLGTCFIKIRMSREKRVRGGLVLDGEEQGNRQGRISLSGSHLAEERTDRV